MVTIFENISLKERNTFAVDAKAKYFCEIKNEFQLLSLLETQVFQRSNRFFLGGGSNVLFLDDFDGLVVNLSNKGIKILESTDEQVFIEVAAGENWHKFVEISLRNKYYGIENLALIPGTIGGAVVQNIGAYGVELKHFLHSVRGIDVNFGEFTTLASEECHLKYRTSIFKTILKDNFIITSAVFKLSKRPKVNLSYNELKQIATKFPFIKPDPKYVFDQVVRLRQSKLPDIGKYPNAGSFFKNPVVGEEQLKLLKSIFPDVPNHQVEDGGYKIPAGWLIEMTGWKGRRIGNVGTYDKHALVIINYGVNKGMEILEFAKKIQQDVYEKFNLFLEPEVEIVS
ncbi:MAG: UDP-N-acetylmuramate dehydrogenase [Candidatus Kapaibacteriota bacterium]